MHNNPLTGWDPSGHALVKDQNQIDYLNGLISEGGGNAIWAQSQLDSRLFYFDDEGDRYSMIAAHDSLLDLSPAEIINIIMSPDVDPLTKTQAVVAGGVRALEYGVATATTGVKTVVNGASKVAGWVKGLLTNKTTYFIDKLPENPSALVKNGWKDVTPDGMLNNTSSREYLDDATGLKVRFDAGKQGANGFEGVDHYHVYNPNSTGKMDYYLDINGNPVPKGSKASHIISK